MGEGFSGRCLCGDAAFECSEPARSVVLCYCRDCQRVSGGSPAVLVIVRRGAVRMTSGILESFGSLSEAGRPVERRFCGRCGTQMFSAIDANPDILVIKAGVLDDMSWAQPRAVAWTESANDWMRPEADLPRIAGRER